ncbi:MAG: tRNA pseudouridine(55) synthase TruB [Ignavibacteriae bacterium]|nr:MAG: tRNA pseudouridine(55) synthase TruB [Ignavibacteriota bacterium]
MMRYDWKIEKENGLMLLIDKPKDYSSAKIVNIVKKRLNVKKAGHSGTLDPRATGLLIVCTDKMTKSLNELLDCGKEYEGVMIIGEITGSFDGETEVTKKLPIDNITNEMIYNTAKEFMGEIEQLPPMYSAVKYKGKPLYKYARKNQLVERITRKVLINKFEINKINLPEVHFTVGCSKGTYIRTLANDFGEKLGVGAYLKELRRLKIGDYDVRNSVTLEDFLLINPRIVNN